MAFKLGRQGEYGKPDPKLVEDAREAAEQEYGKVTPRTLMKRLCIGDRAASALISGGRLPLTLIDEISRNLYHKEDGSFRVRLLNMMSVSRCAVTRTLQKLQHIAQLVEQFHGVLHGTPRMACWSLPPRSVIRELCEAVDHSYDMLVQIHRDCPELDKYVFKKSPKLYAEVTRGEPKPRKRKARKHRKRKASEQ